MSEPTILERMREHLQYSHMASFDSGPNCMEVMHDEMRALLDLLDHLIKERETSVEAVQFLTRCIDEYRAQLAKEQKRSKADHDAFTQILRGIPASDGHGGLYHMHFDDNGNELGQEQVDPMAVIDNIIGIASRAIEMPIETGEKIPGTNRGIDDDRPAS